MKQLRKIIDNRSKPVYKNTFLHRLGLNIIYKYELYLFVLPAAVVIFIFCYLPMYGVQIAFKDFRPVAGIFGSKWVGFEHFTRFFRSFQFWDLIKNTLRLSIYSLAVGFPIPIIFALLLNQIKHQRYKKLIQTVTYMPHFISVVVLVSMLVIFLSPSQGLYGNIMRAIGIEKPMNVLGNEKMFPTIYILSSIWQHAGWDSIIYLAALSSIDISLHEAAKVDGASKPQRIWYIDIPSLIPTIVILLILSLGSIMSVGFEKAYLMQNSLNLVKSEIIATYVYKVGLISAQYSFSAAVDLFNTIINFILLVAVNTFARRISDISLW